MISQLVSCLILPVMDAFVSDFAIRSKMITLHAIIRRFNQTNIQVDDRKQMTLPKNNRSLIYERQ